MLTLHSKPSRKCFQNWPRKRVQFELQFWSIFYTDLAVKSTHFGTQKSMKKYKNINLAAQGFSKKLQGARMKPHRGVQDASRELLKRSWSGFGPLGIDFETNLWPVFDSNTSPSVPSQHLMVLAWFWTKWHCFRDQFLTCFRYQDLSRRSKLVFHGWQCTFHRRALPPAFFFTICIHKILKCLIKLPSISSYATIHNQWNRISCNLLCGLSSEPHEFTATCNEVADVANKKCLHCRLHCALTKHLLLCHDT